MNSAMADAACVPWLQLVRTPGIGPAIGGRLVAAFDGAAAAVDAGPSAWRGVGLPEPLIRALADPQSDGVAADLAWCAAGEGRSILTLDDPRYPARLKSLAAPPLVLFAHGDVDLFSLPQLAVVGSRSATPQGLSNARAFAEALAARGLTITSGLALGVDAAAHEGALAANGLTIAVCATGLDRVYPARHRALAQKVADLGLLISEFPIGVGPQPEHFPRRNRLIAGLSLGVLVVEAAVGSGSLITARLAVEQGREVFAIPGSIHNPQARGCHQLIRQGAKLVESVDDILEEIGPQIGSALRDSAAASGPTCSATDEASSPIITALGHESLDFDQLAARSGLAVAELSTALLSLELAGRVAQGADGRYSVVYA